MRGEPSAAAYFAGVDDQGPKGGMSFEGLRGKTGGRFSKNDLMPS